MRLFDLLTKEEKKKCQLLNFDKDEIIFHEDDKCHHIALVIKGTLNIVSYTLLGQEILYNQIKEGEMFGNNLLFSNHPFYKGNVIGVNKGQILLINKNNLLMILENNKEFLINYLSYQADFTKELNGKIKLLSLTSIEERLLYYLKEKKSVKIHSVTDLAKQLFLSREALSRTISKLVKENKILKEGNVLSIKH